VQAARIDERFGPARFELGKLQFERNNYRDAIGWLERIPSSDALHYQARFLAGLAYFYLSDYTNSEQAFELVERALPLAEVLNNLGAALLRQSKPEEALRHFAKASEADPREAAFHFNRGYALWRLNRLPAAAEAFRQVLERNPEDQEASLFLQLSEQPPPQAQSDPQFHARERLRTKLEESAYRQLTAILQRSKK
jgi:tetratricopeptide (TPR) repeat protein